MNFHLQFHVTNVIQTEKAVSNFSKKENKKTTTYLSILIDKAINPDMMSVFVLM